MERGAAGMMWILYTPSSLFKVHQSMCEVLLRLINKALVLLSEIEEARPRGTAGMQGLCSLNEEIEKGKLVLQQCCQSSKLYLVYTANAIMSKCERSRKMLEISFIQIQTNVPLLLFKKISNLVEDIKSATFTLDSSEKEAGKFVHQLVHGCASASSADENFKLNVLQSAPMRLHITSPKAILIEKISIKKLIKEIDDIDPKKKKILKYFLYLLKQHGNQIVAEKSEVIAEIKIEDVSSLDQSYQSKLTDQWLDSVSPENFLCAISSFLEEAIHQGNTDAQRTVLQLFLTYLKKSRHQSVNLTEKLFDQLVYLLISPDEVQEEVLAIIEVLSSDSAAASGALAVISGALCSQARDSQGSALRILGNFSSDDELCPRVFSIDSIVFKLVPFLKNTKLSRYALLILQNLCYIEAAKISIIETSGCLASIAELLDTGNEEVQEISMSILITLCSQRLEYSQMIFDKGVISPLSSLSVNGSDKTKTCALELLRLLDDVICIKNPQDFPSTINPEPAPLWSPNGHSQENKKSSSLLPSRLKIFPRARR